MKTEPANLDDMRSWGRALRSYPGAFGNGMIEPDEPYFDGGLRGYIPIHEWQVRAIWEVGEIGKDAANSGWRLIGNFREYKLEVRGYRLRGGFFSSSKWLATFGFCFGDITSGNASAGAQINNVGFLKARTIPDIFLTVDKLLRAEWELKKSLGEALSAS